MGRKSSTNPVRISLLERESKSATTSRVESRVSTLSRQPRQSSGDGSQIPRPRIRSNSSERLSSIRRSNLKPPGRIN